MYFMQYTLVYLRPCYKKVQMINCIVTANLLALNSIQDTISFKYSRDQHRRRLSQTRNLDHSCFRRNYSFLNLATVHKSSETIQGRKLFDLSALTALTILSEVPLRSRARYGVSYRVPGID